MFSRPKKSLSKASIREHITDEAIFQYYLGVDPKSNTKFKSPLREDNNPTCNFFYTKSGTLWIKDHSGHFAGNCFDLVMKLYNLNLTETLRLIASDFNLTKIKVKAPERHVIREITHEKTKIQYSTREWNKADDLFWDSFKIDREILAKFKVYPANTLWVNHNPKYRYTKGDPAYVYEFGNGNIKVYFPFRRNRRFMCNTDILQGYNFLPESGNMLVITKSYKDVIVLHNLGIPSVAPQSETQMISVKQFREFNSRFINIYSLYDFDLTGIRTANKMRKMYGIKPLFFTNGRFGTIDMVAKDISDGEKLGLNLNKIIMETKTKHGNTGN